MPSGAIGGASAAVEFLELTGCDGLARLDTELNKLNGEMWRAPRILIEAENVALCEANNASALFYGAPLADWLSAMLVDSPQASIMVGGGLHSEVLAAVPCILARQGHSCLLIHIGNSPLERGRFSVSAGMSAGPENWSFTHTESTPESLDEWAHAMSKPLCSLEYLNDLTAAVVSWWGNGDEAGKENSKGMPMPAANATPAAPAFPDGSDIALLVAINGHSHQPLESLEEKLNTLHRDGRSDAAEPATTFTASSFAARKKAVLAQGWPMPRERWTRLMAFADRTLVRSSEQSRLGAG
ncbi:MAG: hypothetical protein JWP52_529 [Rhizobacter sp.]|nr:hypothetical protein [Rhizobacter sp.]